MSLNAMRWAIAQAIPRPAHKLVLIMLGNRVNQAALAPVAFPSVASLVTDTSLDRKTVLAALQALQESGHIEDTGIRYGRTKQIVGWRLRMTGYAPEKSTENGTVTTPAKGPKNGTLPHDFSHGKGPKNGTPSPVKESQKRDTEPVSNKANRGAKAKGHFVPPALPDWIPLEAWEAHLEVRAAKRAWYTEYGMRLALAKLRDWRREGIEPIDVLNLAIENGWTGLFKPREQYAKTIRPAANSANTAAEAARLIAEQLGSD